MATSRQAALLLAAACLVLSVAGRRVTSPAPLLAGKDTPDAARDAVASLPGAPPLKSKMYSGYITVDEAAGRALFYVLVESEQAPPKDPLVLWLNGGPGCSSIGGGFMTEMGPYYPTPGGKLEVNPTRWNQVANMLYVESPAFVGFSYSNTSADAVVGDKRTADDARKFMLGFYSKFPRYASTAFYVAGESYAGHYVPNLAWAIVKGNSAGIGHIPLKGFLVGNAWTDATIDNKGAADMWLTHALISRSTYDSLVSACNLSDVGPLLTDDPAADCDAAQDSAFIEMGNINIYEIYADICPGDFAGARKHAPAAWKPRTARALASSLGLRAAARGPIPAYDPCIDDETASYLNLPEVQEALHANVSGSLPGPWSDCTDAVDYSRSDLLSSMLPTWHSLLAEGGLDILVFSGDVDGIVPVTGTRAWVDTFDLPVTRAWRPWYPKGTPQVGGYTTAYGAAKPGGNGLTLATVRNAGHMVPYTQPERAFYLFSTFLAGKEL